MITRGTAVRVTIEGPGDREPAGGFLPWAQHSGWLDRPWDGEGPVYLRQSATRTNCVVFPAGRVMFVEELEERT